MSGRGTIVLALHGQPGTGRDFVALARALDGTGRVVAPDRPGWGDRAAEPAAGFAAGADDAARILDREGVERAVVLGFSWGGGVALELARRHPDRVAGLVLAASIGPGEPTAVDRVLALPVAGRAICGSGLAATRLALRRSAFHGILGRGMRGVDPNHVRRFADDCLSRAALVSFMVEQRALVREFPAVLEALSGLRVPTTVVSGERDRLIAPGSARRLADALGAELQIVPGAGHFLPGVSAAVLAEAVVAVAARADW
ncbi:MAG TPA: alpha/beta hydrolase [Acidimicrobiia bacterium]|nr:alpha/beta hydrolase [Acidimicrobiia bacterium]